MREWRMGVCSSSSSGEEHVSCFARQQRLMPLAVCTPARAAPCRAPPAACWRCGCSRSGACFQNRRWRRWRPPRRQGGWRACQRMARCEQRVAACCCCRHRSGKQRLQQCCLLPNSTQNLACRVICCSRHVQVALVSLETFDVVPLAAARGAVALAAQQPRSAAQRQLLAVVVRAGKGRSKVLMFAVLPGAATSSGHQPALQVAQVRAGHAVLQWCSRWGRSSAAEQLLLSKCSCRAHHAPCTIVCLEPRWRCPRRSLAWRGQAPRCCWRCRAAIRCCGRCWCRRHSRAAPARPASSSSGRRWQSATSCSHWQTT